MPVDASTGTIHTAQTILEMLHVYGRSSAINASHFTKKSVPKHCMHYMHNVDLPVNDIFKIFDYLICKLQCMWDASSYRPSVLHCI